MNSTNKVAIITGASKGIGKAIAGGLGKMKYQTIVIGRSQSDLKTVADEIKNAGGPQPVSFSVDITNSEKVKETVAEVAIQFGRIDILLI